MITMKNRYRSKASSGRPRPFKESLLPEKINYYYKYRKEKRNVFIVPGGVMQTGSLVNSESK